MASSSSLPDPTPATAEEHSASVDTGSLPGTLSAHPTVSRTTASPGPTSNANSTLFNGTYRDDELHFVETQWSKRDNDSASTPRGPTAP